MLNLRQKINKKLKNIQKLKIYNKKINKLIKIRKINKIIKILKIHLLINFLKIKNLMII